MQGLSGEAQAMQAQLVRKYVASLPGKRARIEDCWKLIQCSEWSADSLGKLKQEVHRLSGSAGSYGLEELGAFAQSFEQSLKSVAYSAQQRSDIGIKYARLIGLLSTVGSDKT